MSRQHPSQQVHEPSTSREAPHPLHHEAATPALVIVGFLMQVSGISWKDYEIAIPAFLTIIPMPFTYSITVGIGSGFVSFVVIKIAVGKIREIHPLMAVTGVLFVVYFTLGPIKTLLGV